MIHGGDIYRNQVDLDYSVNINPLGIPQSVIKALQDAVECCTHYPDPNQEQLKLALANYEQVADVTILCGNGASELFVAVEHAVNPKCTLIPVPSFLGYEQAAATTRTRIVYYPMKEQNQFRLDEGILVELTAEVDLLYLTNPNNPTGQIIDLELLIRILNQCEKESIYVVLDECFLPFCEVESQYRTFFREQEYPHLIRIRAFTKTYAIPGVRIGYLMCQNEELRQRIATQLPEWNLSVFAQLAGVAATQEVEFLEESRGILKQERLWLERHLQELGMYVIQSDANYILFYSSIPLYQPLLERRILVRDCSNYRGLKAGYYRIAIKLRTENEQLIQAIKEIQQKKND